VSSFLLKQYVRLLLRELDGSLLKLPETAMARVPNQLIEPHDQENENEEITEFSGASAVPGYVGPLGMDPDKLNRRKNARKK